MVCKLIFLLCRYSHGHSLTYVYQGLLYNFCRTGAQVYFWVRGHFSGWVPGNNCSKLMGAYASIAPVLSITAVKTLEMLKVHMHSYS